MFVHEKLGPPYGRGVQVSGRRHAVALDLHGRTAIAIAMLASHATGLLDKRMGGGILPRRALCRDGSAAIRSHPPHHMPSHCHSGNTLAPERIACNNGAALKRTCFAFTTSGLLGVGAVTGGATSGTSARSTSCSKPSMEATGGGAAEAAALQLRGLASGAAMSHTAENRATVTQRQSKAAKSHD